MSKQLLSLFAIPFVLIFSIKSTGAQTYTIGADNGENGQFDYPTPFGDYYKTMRTQFLYRASELTAAGMTSGYITEIKWDVVSVAPTIGVTEDYTVKMLATGVTSLGLTTWQSGATTVWGPTDYTPFAGINSFTLTTPFFWDGTSNLIIEICGGSNLGTYTKNAKVVWTGPLGFNGSRTHQSDLEASPCTYTGTDYWDDVVGGADYRPQVTLVRIDGVNCSGTPNAGAAESTASSVCVGEEFTVSVDPIIEVGITYQWQKSSDGVSWANIAGAISPSYNATQSVQTLYRCMVTCTPSGLFDFSDPVNVLQNDPTDCYCIPTYTTGTTDGDYISHVVLGDINNITGASPSPFYNYYDALSTDLNVSGSYTITITVGSYISNNGAAAWIDYDADGDFTDVGEKLGEVTGLAAFGVANINFSVPATATLGTTRLRVRDVWNTIGMQPCTEYGYGETEDYNININPGNPPVADFTFSMGAEPTIYFFDNSTNTPTSWSWNFGDGGTSIAENPYHTFLTNGTYSVCLVSSNAYGTSPSHCENVVIDSYVPPVADFTFSMAAEPTISFNDNSTNSPTSWSWDFGDGVGTSTLENPTYTYADNGTYSVCLISTNAVGSSALHCESVTIDTYMPTEADFSFSLAAEPTVAFTDLSTNDPYDWYWDFGDGGGTSTEQNPDYTYAANGTYYVCLTATNVVNSDVKCEFILIDSYAFVPEASFTYFGDPTVFFVDFSTEDPTSWYWDFGDGSTSVEQNPTHTYAMNGTYIVCLTATNGVGSNTVCQTIVVDGYPVPEALFTYTGDPSVTFTDLSTNDPTIWFWDFDDGTFSTEQNPVHAFALNGVYIVCLTVTGAGGADTYCDNVEIETAQLPPVSDFYYELAGGFTVAFYDLSGNSPTDWTWDFGDGSISLLQNPSHTYATGGSYTVCLTTSNPVGNDLECKSIEVPTSIDGSLVPIEELYPNPSTDKITLSINENLTEYNLDVLNTLGQHMNLDQLISQTDGNTIQLNIRDLPAGNYFVVIQTNDKTFAGKFIKE